VAGWGALGFGDACGHARESDVLGGDGSEAEEGEELSGAREQTEIEGEAATMGGGGCARHRGRSGGRKSDPHVGALGSAGGWRGTKGNKH
jgi:hypothetical protein